MDWIEIVGAVGFGAIVTKLLDILWLQRVMLENDRRRWLRDKRLQAFATVTRDFITLGLTRTDPSHFHEGYVAAAEAMLLAGDDELATRIDRYIVRLDRFYDLDRKGENRESERLYSDLNVEARNLVKMLRESITNQ
jgi:hypothetical protein